MALREVKPASNTKYISPGKMNIGDKFKGIFLETVENKPFDGVLHKIAVNDDEVICINGAGTLDARLREVPKNTYVEITYDGKKKMTSGKFIGKDAHQFTVIADLPETAA